MFIHTISNKQHVAEGSDNNNLHPWFVTGLTDAKVIFMVGFNKSNDYRMGYQIKAFFFFLKIAMHKKDHGLLYSIKNWSRKNN